jgi:hypothetical protein
MNLDLRTAAEKLAGLTKPSVETVSELDLNVNDWLIVCAGFEYRTIEALKRATARGSPLNVLIVLYEPFIPQNKAEDLRELCVGAGANHIELTYDRRDPLDFGSTILKTVACDKGRIFIDVSAMSRLLIVQTIVALGNRPRGLADCFVVYTEAETYPPTQNEVEAELVKSVTDPTFSVLFLSSGVFEITVVPELSSSAPAAAQSRLIAFPSLDAHQLISLRNELQPSRFTFIEGLPPNPQLQWRHHAISRINQLEALGNAERCLTSTLDYVQTLDCLLNTYSRHAIQERLIISPTGSKMQTVAVGIFRSFIEDVQIVYPTPKDFRSPSEYTLGASTVHSLSLDEFVNGHV